MKSKPPAQALKGLPVPECRAGSFQHGEHGGFTEFTEKTSCFLRAPRESSVFSVLKTDAHYRQGRVNPFTPASPSRFRRRVAAHRGGTRRLLRAGVVALPVVEAEFFLAECGVRDLDGDAAVGAVAFFVRGRVGQQVLRAQLLVDLREGGVQLAAVLGEEGAPPVPSATLRRYSLRRPPPPSKSSSRMPMG